MASLKAPVDLQSAILSILDTASPCQDGCVYCANEACDPCGLPSMVSRPICEHDVVARHPRLMFCTPEPKLGLGLGLGLGSDHFSSLRTTLAAEFRDRNAPFHVHSTNPLVPYAPAYSIGYNPAEQLPSRDIREMMTLRPEDDPIGPATRMSIEETLEAWQHMIAATELIWDEGAPRINYNTLGHIPASAPRVTLVTRESLKDQSKTGEYEGNKGKPLVVDLRALKAHADVTVEPSVGGSVSLVSHPRLAAHTLSGITLQHFDAGRVIVDCDSDDVIDRIVTNQLQRKLDTLLSPEQWRELGSIGIQVRPCTDTDTSSW